MNIRNTRFIFPGLIVLIFVITYSYTFDSKLAPLGDNASYYMLGKGLAAGSGFVNISNPEMTPNNHYPPGYPALMSIFMHLTQDIFFFKLLNGFLLIASLLLFFQIIRRITKNELLALIATIFCLLNYHLLQYGSMMMSEVPFMFFSFLSIYFFILYQKASTQKFNRYLLFSLVACLIAYYTRSLGIALFAGLCLSLLIRKKWLHLLHYFLGFVLLALPWFIRGQNLGGGSYIHQLQMVNPYQPALGNADTAEFVSRFFRNLTRYITIEIPNGIFPINDADYQSAATGGQWIGGLLLLVLIGYGIYRLQKLRWALFGYLIFTLAILMLWPDVWIGVRFIVPVIPLIGFGMLNGLWGLLEKFGALIKRPGLTWLLIIPLLVVISSVTRLHKLSSQPEHPAWTNYYAIADWLKKNEKSTVIVACGKPNLFYTYSGTFTMRYPFEKDPEKLIQELEEKNVDYVVIDQVYGNTIRYLVPAVRKYPKKFAPVYHLKNPDTYLLKLN